MSWSLTFFCRALLLLVVLVPEFVPPPELLLPVLLGLLLPLPSPQDPPRRRPDAAWVAGAASSASLSGASSPSRASSKVPQQLPRILRQLLLRRHPCHLRRSPIPLPRPGRRARPSSAAAGLPRGGPLPPPLPPVRSGFLPERLHLYNFNFKHNQADVHQLVVKVSGRHRHVTSAGGVVLAFPAAWVRVVAVGGCALRFSRVLAGGSAGAAMVVAAVMTEIWAGSCAVGCAGGGLGGGASGGTGAAGGFFGFWAWALVMCWELAWSLRASGA